jgi:hypothetical protein
LALVVHAPLREKKKKKKKKSRVKRVSGRLAAREASSLKYAVDFAVASETYGVVLPQRKLRDLHVRQGVHTSRLHINNTSTRRQLRVTNCAESNP